MVFIGALSGLSFVMSLPFRVYYTFVLEEKFGFNKTTVRTFVLDMVKAIVLSVALGGPLLAGTQLRLLFVVKWANNRVCTGVLAFFLYAGDLAWLYCWGVITTFSLVMAFLAPVCILPLFYDLKPLEAGELQVISLVLYGGDDG